MNPRIFFLVRNGLAGILLLFLFASRAFATHELDHRFTVWGEVVYEDGTPVVDETITLTVKDGIPIGTLQTNEKGRYRVVLHVHDKDVGKIFDMTVRGVTTKVQIEFDPKNKGFERGKRVDFTIERQ